MRGKKILLMVLALILTTITAASATNIPNKESPENQPKEALYTLTNDMGHTIEVYNGIVYEDEELDTKKEERIKYILRNKQTGQFVNVYTGTVDTEEVKDNFEVIIPSAPSKPTEIKWEEYTSDWSGTVNFTYTKYAFPSGDFIAWADQPFSVVLYDYKYDTSFPRVYARYTNGRYEVETGGGDFTYYCTLSNTNKGVPMTNAIYKSIPYCWHNN
ncbi:hypothetical protein [Sporanaerobacter acetigenes]|uniref:hypothetical protein n=1 Tax=Sporanaerobacter acetigenes TaxID=165813 RepID=UPI0010502ECC|nr:hypothetical protein [Sporanaerobacter acetigenes]